jgi:pimeloyl-ACP methyl ester carboxylesterase
MRLREMVEVVRRFLREQVGEPVFLVGTSLGGALCAAVAEQSPKLIKALALISPAGASITAEQLAVIAAALTPRSNREVRALAEKLFHRPRLGAKLLMPYLRRMYLSPTVTAIFEEAKTAEFLSPKALQGLTMPTLLIWGGSEKLLPYECVDYFRAHLLPHARIEVVEGFGHVPQVEAPKELVGRLLRFCAEAVAPRPEDAPGSADA